MRMRALIDGHWRVSVVGSVSVEAEDSFGQLSLKGLQLGQQPIVKDPRLGPVEEAWQDAVFNYLHGGERVELSMEYTTASRKKALLAFSMLLFNHNLQERSGDHHAPRHLTE